MKKAAKELADSDLQAKVVELVERLLLRRFPEFDREEIRMKFKLHDIRESKVWKEAHNEGMDENKRDMVPRLFATGMSVDKIAAVVKLPESEVRKIVSEIGGPQKS